MGAVPYWYTVKYRPDLNAVLAELREREFRAGRYNPVMPFIDFPITLSSPAPGPQHRSIQEAVTAAGADGTRSILDIAAISDTRDYGVAYRLSPEALLAMFGTDQPTAAEVDAGLGTLEELDRGQAFCLVLYSDGAPSEVLFAGCSYD
jgi:hypothetical protein